MRFRHILLEYDRSKSLARFTKPLWDQCTKREDHGGVFSNSIEKHMEDMDGPSWDDASRTGLYQMVITDVLAMIEANDPTPNKEYVQWMCLRYIQDGIHLLEDMPRARQYLTVFHDLKRRGFFRRNPDDAKLADINQFKRLSDLGDFVARATETKYVTSGEQERQLRAKAVEESLMLHDGPDYMVVCPETMEASQYWGRNTQWCTAALEDNRFEQYQEAPLYIILDKKNNRRWQLYFEYRPTFMDERDEPIVWEEFPPEVWLAFEWPHELFPTVVLSARATKNPELCRKLLSTLSNSQLMTAYFWFDRDDRKVFAPLLKERMAGLKSKQVGKGNWDIDIYALPDALIKLAAAKPMSYFLHIMDMKFNHPDNAFVSDYWVRPAENFEIAVHSSRAIFANIGGKSWTCWRDATSYHNRVVWCYCGPDEMRISKGYMNDGPQDVGNVYNINESEILPDQDAWHAVINELDRPYDYQ